MKKISIKLTRTHIMLALIVFLIWISMCANKKEVENGFFPITEHIEHGQIEEMRSYHSEEGLAIEEDGYITIKNKYHANKSKERIQSIRWKRV